MTSQLEAPLKTLIVRYKQKVMFIITNHPEFRFKKLCESCPVPLQFFGVTSCKAKTIKDRFASRHIRDEWFYLTDEFEQYLHQTIEDLP
jgi:hypothetical protein